MALEVPTLTLQETVMQLAAPALAELGFQYSEAKSDNVTWAFVRAVSGATHTIYWVQHRYIPNALGVQLHSSAFGTMPLHLLLNGRYPDFVTFSDEETQRQVVEELLRLTIQHGVPWLDVHSTLPLRAAEELEYKLVEDAERLALSFASHLGLGIEDPGGLRAVGTLLLSKRQESATPDWDLMVGSAAYYGEVVRMAHGGKWTWDSQVKRAVVLGCKSAKGDSNNLVAPLAAVTRFWSTGHDPDDLFHRYRQFKHLLDCT